MYFSNTQLFVFKLLALLADPVLWCIVLAPLLALDWHQTVNIAKHPARWYERNVILGKHPTVRAVNIYFACVCLLVGLIAYFAPVPVALALLVGLTAVQVWAVTNNARLGIW